MKLNGKIIDFFLLHLIYNYIYIYIHTHTHTHAKFLIRNQIVLNENDRSCCQFAVRLCQQSLFGFCSQSDVRLCSRLCSVSVINLLAQHVIRLCHIFDNSLLILSDNTNSVNNLLSFCNQKLVADCSKSVSSDFGYLGCSLKKGNINICNKGIAVHILQD